MHVKKETGNEACHLYIGSWWTGRPGVLRFMGLQRVRHDWVTELNTPRVAYLCALVSAQMTGINTNYSLSVVWRDTIVWIDRWSQPTNAEAEAPILWPHDGKSWLIGKDPAAGKVWGQDKRLTEDEMFGWHHSLNGHEFEKTLDREGQGSLMCCSPWGHKELDMTDWLNNNFLLNQFTLSQSTGIFLVKFTNDFTVLNPMTLIVTHQYL